MAAKWYSLFSHTGKETEALTQSLFFDGIRLEVAFTDNETFVDSLNLCGGRLVKVTSRSVMNDLLCTKSVVADGSIITLNGYMGILPERVLQNLHDRGCKVYNIHPAPIQLYPELRGKDPQERVYEGIKSGKYQYIGVVIHEVDAGVDTGKIVHWYYEIVDPNITKDKLYARLHTLGTRAWEAFFKERMYEDGTNS